MQNTNPRKANPIAVNILVLYYSRGGATRNIALAIAQGIETAGDANAVVRTVPSVSPDSEKSQASVPSQGEIYCDADDIKGCDGLALGSPTRFGNMAAPLKYFIDQCSEHWVNGDLVGKPAGVFTSTSSMHGGQETTLLSMMLPLLHQGMLITGIPYSEQYLSSTHSGGTPYGPSHVEMNQQKARLSDEEKRLAIAFGERLAKVAKQLK